MVGKGIQQPTLYLVFQVSQPSLPPGPHPQPSLSCPCSLAAHVPQCPPSLLPANILGAPWKPHTEWRKKQETIHFPLILLPHFLQAHSLVSLGPGARVCLFGCPGHLGMEWAQIPGLTPSWSFFLLRVPLGRAEAGLRLTSDHRRGVADTRQILEDASQGTVG